MHPANAAFIEEGTIINKAILASKIEYDKTSETLKVEYMLPVHKKLEVKFKPFVDVSDLSKIRDITSVLENNNFKDVKQSDSAEKQ